MSIKKMTKDELEGLVARLRDVHKLKVIVLSPYEKEFVDQIDIHIEWK